MNGRVAPTTLRSRGASLARTLVSVALLVVLLRTLDIGTIKSAVALLPWWALAAVLLILLGQVLVLAWRWCVITSRIGGCLQFGDALRLTFVGLFFSQTLPTSIGGDAMRIWEARRLGLSGELALGSVIIERVTGLAAIAMLVTLSLPFVWADLGESHLRWAFLALAPAALALVAALAFADLLPLQRLPESARAYVRFIAGGLRRIGGSVRATSDVLLLGIIAAAIGISSAFVIGCQIGIGLGLAAYLVALGGAVLLTVVPVSLAGWGVREVAMVGILGAMGVPAEKAIVVSLLFGVGVLMVSLPGGVLWRSANRRPVARGKNDDDRDQ